jgi:hypothetical protein
VALAEVGFDCDIKPEKVRSSFSDLFLSPLSRLVIGRVVANVSTVIIASASSLAA